MPTTYPPDMSIAGGLIDMPFRPDRPYNELPPLPPGEDVETKAVLKACIAARAVLAELQVSGRLNPNQAVLINSIPLLEAQASSEIENILTTTDRLFRFANEAGNEADPATKEALRCRTALSDGSHTLKQPPTSTSTAVAVCRTIKGGRIGSPRDTGHGSDERGNGRGRLHPARGASATARQAGELGTLHPRGRRY
jgi:Fic family protein